MPIESRRESAAFDPDTVRILTAVFDQVCQALNINDLTEPIRHARRDKLARLIIALAKAGERDQAKLRDDAVTFMRLTSG